MDCSELSAQERSALVTDALHNRPGMTWKEIMELCGLSYPGARLMMLRIARVIPLWYDEREKTWHLLGDA